MRICLFFLIFISTGMEGISQIPVNLKEFNQKNGARATVKGNQLQVEWPAGAQETGKIIISLKKNEPLISSIQLQNRELVEAADPVFLLTVGKRDLISQNGWNIFFDKVPLKPHQTYKLRLDKQTAKLSSAGNRTCIQISGVRAPDFSGVIEISLYNGSPLFNIAAVISTNTDSTAILYDAGLVSSKKIWDRISWSDTEKNLQTITAYPDDTAVNQKVKYRAIIGNNSGGSFVIFPAPHQYFYPLDEAFNLGFTWYGNGYRRMIGRYGMGIRQDLNGDHRFVPWFNAPPQTKQRLNFFCLMSNASAGAALEAVKAFTHSDQYVKLDGYKTLASHFHNEFITKVVLAGKPVPERPSFVTVFKDMGVNIVHLAEFHGTGHPRGPDSMRLRELDALFKSCRRLSDSSLLILPGEEPNNFFGGHWLAFFPKPVYWIMSRKPEKPFVTEDPEYGKVYRISNAEEMLKLLELERGLAWTAHPRTKGSTGYPDKYENEFFFRSDRFLGGAWKAMPADLSQPRLGKRVLDLMDDMNNWGYKKKVLSEADLFSIEPENEMYAHMNVNYLQLKQLPVYDQGWQSVLDVLQQGRFFSTTGEVLIPDFTVNKKSPGDSVRLDKAGMADIAFSVQWTFPLNFAEIISGDGKNVYRHSINLDETLSFGSKTIRLPLNLKGRSWVRLEVWDIAADGAFTQTIWLK